MTKISQIIKDKRERERRESDKKRERQTRRESDKRIYTKTKVAIAV